MDRTVAILVIGNEVLAGAVEELNSSYLSRELHALGADLREVRMVPDDVPAIGKAVAELSGAYDVLFTTGGVGPTHDDVTMEGVARGLGRGLTRNPDMEQALRDFYGDAVNEHLLRMADLPDDTIVEWDEGLRIPAVRVENVWIFPGEPTVLRYKFERIKHRFQASPYFVRRFYTRFDEAQLAGTLARLQDDFPRVAVGSYPVYDTRDYSVMVSLESKDRGAFEDAVNRLSGALPITGIVRIE